MEIKCTDKAEESFSSIIDYLSNNWSQREVENFVQKIYKVIDYIRQNPYMYVVSTKRKDVRRALVGKLTSLLYIVRERKQEIELVLFWNNRKNPKKLKLK